MKKTIGLLSLALLGACSSMYYATMEKFGYQKRDLLVARVEDARESQGEAKEKIQTTFEAFKGLTGFDGGELEKQYNHFKGLHTQCKERADDVRNRIIAVEDVSTAMFSEWAEEISQIQNPELRSKSELMKGNTEVRYNELIAAMRSAEQRMQPVLTAFGDQVLFLKHNLNAAAISSLETESAKIQSDVAELIADMQKSMDQADEFLASLPQANG